MVRMKILKNRDEWLSERKLGGSDAAAIMGESPWMSNVDLWKIKTGRMKQKELSENALVLYGQKAEEHLRELFALDFPDLKVFYEPNNLWTNDNLKGFSVSLDGWLEDQSSRFGVLEIKTVKMQSGTQRRQWEDGMVPQHYFLQLLWEMGVTEAEFAILLAQMTYEKDGDILKVTKHFRVERKDVEDDIEEVKRKGAEFWRYVEEDREPPLILPGFGR